MSKKLTDTAETVLERRYYLKDSNGNIIEDWDKLCARVAKHVAMGDSELEKEFYNVMYELEFLPNSPCLMNAGTDIGSLSACFVVPVEDSMEGIFDAVKWGALIHKTGGGTGYSFSRLRGKNSTVHSTQGVASGPVSFAEVFNAATETVKQGGKRRGANMGVLRVDHPDIEDFIMVKSDLSRLTNFNLSVAITNDFMQNVLNGDDEANRIFDLIAERAHASGEPGIIYIDTANQASKISYLGDYETTNPCGEQFLLPFDSCSLGSINLSKFVSGGKIDWKRLRRVVITATRFLNNTIDVNKFPLHQIEEATKRTRNIGLGIMGLHDLLIELRQPYDSQAGMITAAAIMKSIHAAAHEESVRLSCFDGPFPAYKEEFGLIRRNANLTTCAPTGTISMIADCSSGCEPLFSIVMVKKVMDGDLLFVTNKQFERVARQEGFYSEGLMKKIADTGSVLHPEIPEYWQEIFKTAQDISPEDHVLMQSVIQNNGNDSGVSKTVNLPHSATVEDVKNIYRLAWEYGCKGVTVFRDGSRGGDQVLNTTKVFDTQTATVTTTGPVKAELPDTLRARRYKVKLDNEENIYILICFDNVGQPMEVFAKFPFENMLEYREKSVMYTTVCRLISLALRYGIPVDEIIKQLDKASGSMFDLPAQITKLLKMFLSETNQSYKVKCPDCKEGMLVFKEGCQICESCGYSKCS